MKFFQDLKIGDLLCCDRLIRFARLLSVVRSLRYRFEASCLLASATVSRPALRLSSCTIAERLLARWSASLERAARGSRGAAKAPGAF